MLSDAVPCFSRALELKPDYAEAHYNLGNAMHALGMHDNAVACYGRALELAPNYAEAHNGLGTTLKDQGKLEDATRCYRRAVELKPDYAEAYYNLGNAFQDQGRLDEAIASHRQAVHWRPNLAEAQNNLGNAFKDQGKLDDAVASYLRAVELRPDFYLAYNNLGNAYQDQGRLDDAVACFRRTVELRPSFAEAHYNLGNAYQDMGKPDEAVVSYRRAVELKPGFAVAHYNMGNACQDNGKVDDAISCYRRALELKPDYVEAYCNLGNALLTQGKPDEAAACFRRAQDLKPDYAEALSNLGNAFKDEGNLDEAVASYRRALNMKPDLAQALSNLVFALNYCFGYDAKAIHEEHRRWNQKCAEPVAKFIQPHANERSAARRLRLGYVSPDFRGHVVGRNLLPLFREHDRQQFKIFCYANMLDRDAFTDQFQGYADGWRNVARLTDEALAQRIREDRIDILVDLALHTAHNRLLALARKPAPVQVTFAGYPGTTGLATIDYRLTDPYLDPPGLYDRYYAEESIRLPDTFWCYDPLSQETAVNALPALEKGHLTFGCLNNYAKVNPAVLRLWAQVLRAVQNSRIVIMAPEGGHRQHALALLAQEGIDPERVQFVGKHKHARYLELYNRLDVGLDTFPYNGHTTSLDSYWMGVPVVTLVGQTVVGRAGLSQLSNLGLPELIAQTPEQFVSIAVGLANDLSRLSRLRATLRERMEGSPLMDARRFARNIEAAYRGMWQRWCAK